MEEYHGRKWRKRSGSGGLVKQFYDKDRSNAGGYFTATKLGEKEERTVKKGRGNTSKVKLKKAAFINVAVKGGVKKARIKTVRETPDNKHYARTNIMTKGALVETDLGKVRITNRVGQDGVINGVLAG